MQKDRSFWPAWAQFLHRSGLAELAAAFLETAGPLRVFMAQAVYAARPFLGLVASADRLQALADLVENQDESRSFAAFIREETSG